MGSAKRVDKPCEDCGALMVSVAPTKRFCFECSKNRERVAKRTYKTVKRKKKTGGLVVKPIINHNAKYCKGCVYWWGGYECSEVCNYIFCENHSRPCPPGKDCTEKVIGKAKRSRHFTIKEL